MANRGGIAIGLVVFIKYKTVGDLSYIRLILVLYYVFMSKADTFAVYLSF